MQHSVTVAYPEIYFGGCYTPPKNTLIETALDTQAIYVSFFLHAQISGGVLTPKSLRPRSVTLAQHAARGTAVHNLAKPRCHR